MKKNFFHFGSLVLLALFISQQPLLADQKQKDHKVNTRVLDKKNRHKLAKKETPTVNTIKGHTYLREKCLLQKRHGKSHHAPTVCPPCPPPLPHLPINGSAPQLNPNALPGAFFPNANVSNLLVPPPQKIDLTFVAGSQGLNPQVFGTPPDTYGVKGLTQFVMAINPGYVSFDSQGKRDKVLNTECATLANLDGNFSLFMANADTRIHYDRLSNRFVMINLVVDDVSINLTGGVGYSGLSIAVSDSGILSSDTQWTVFTVFDGATVPTSNGCPGDVTDPVGAGVIFDFPCTGIDANAIYVAANIFDRTEAYVTNNLFVIQKKSLYEGEGPVVITAFPEVTKTLDGQFVGDQQAFRDASATLMPLDNYDDPNPKFGYAISQDPAFFGKLRLFRIVDAGSTHPSIAGPFITDVLQTYTNNSLVVQDAPFQGQLYGEMGLLLTPDDRPCDSSHINKKQIYAAHNILSDRNGIASVDGDRVSVRWYQLDVTGDSTGRGRGKEKVSTIPALVQAGTLFDTATTNPLYYIYPAIMSNSQGDLSICGTVSGVNQPPSAFFVGKAGTDPKDGTLKIGAVQPNVFATGSGHFTRSLGSGTFHNIGQRWGDMSYSSLDPVDKKTIWTIQEIIHDGVEVEVVAKFTAP